MEWRLTEVTSPHLEHPVSVVAAKGIPYLPDANRLQNLSVYLPATPETLDLIGTPANSFPDAGSPSLPTRYHVHVHGGAWRDPQLTSQSIEPTVAHAYSTIDQPGPITAIAAINYTLSPFPTHPSLPYDPTTGDHADAARGALHPQHVSDVYHGLALLRSFGLTNHSYILSGHSCGASLAFQAALQAPPYFGLENVPDPPCPVALLGLNGLYDLPGLVNGLDGPHDHLRKEYETLLSIAFGPDTAEWSKASPAHFAPGEIARRPRKNKAPKLVVLDQSIEDQLVPTNQKEKLETNLRNVSGLRLLEGHQCTGQHAAPWEQGITIWNSLQDICRDLQER